MNEEIVFDIHPDIRFEEALRVGEKNKIRSFLVAEDGKLGIENKENS